MDSMRLLVDLGDPDKIMAVIPGGVSGRQFSAHLDDQLDAWFSGEPVFLWWSDAAIAEHEESELRLVP
jgi:penicillin amidase